MEASINTYLALEKIRNTDDDKHIVYSYILDEEAKTPYFIPLFVASSQKKAEKKAREIIEVTGHGNVWTYPFGCWIAMGDKSDEKVTLVEIRDNLEKIKRNDDKKDAKIKEERRRIEKEIRQEQQAMQDDNSIESYYFDWVCAVQNKSRIVGLREELTQAEESYNMRVKNIQDKQEKNPTYREEWQELLLQRLRSRGEEVQALAIIAAADDLKKVENL